MIKCLFYNVDVLRITIYYISLDKNCLLHCEIRKVGNINDEIGDAPLECMGKSTLSLSVGWLVGWILRHVNPLGHFMPNVFIYELTFFL